VLRDSFTLRIRESAILLLGTVRDWDGLWLKFHTALV
jgi:hypothetical protein